MFFKKIKAAKIKKAAQLAERLSFVCKCCNKSPLQMDNDWSDRWESGRNSGFCIDCSIGLDEERKRRIEFVRSVVGQVQVESLYRDSNQSSDRWKLAKNLAMTDPYRKKKYDNFIKL